MFDNKRYVTRGVMAEIPLYIQSILWYMIGLVPEPRDYLQIFVLLEEDGKQKIVHRQEQPDYESIQVVSLEDVITAKIYVIDDGAHLTMLLAEEY